MLLKNTKITSQAQFHEALLDFNAKSINMHYPQYFDVQSFKRIFNMDQINQYKMTFGAFSMFRSQYAA